MATGIAHIVGNKGAVGKSESSCHSNTLGISFWINDASFCFISSHFAAHQSRIADRNVNFYEISQMKLGEECIDFANQFKYVFWCVHPKCVLMLKVRRFELSHRFREERSIGSYFYSQLSETLGI